MDGEPGPRRVLHVLSSLDRGGAETLISRWHERIDPAAYQFDYVVSDRNCTYSLEKVVEGLGGRVFRLPKFSFMSMPRFVRAWRRLLASHPEWRIIHCHYYTPGFLYLPVIRRMGRVAILHSHSAVRGLTIQSMAAAALRKPLRWSVANRLAVSNEAGRWAYGDCPFTVIPNGIPAEKFRFDSDARDATRLRLGIQGTFVLGHVGRFDPMKNHRKVVDIFREVASLRPDARLLLVGKGPLEAATVEHVRSLGIADKVIWAGEVGDVASLLSAMDAFVFPSWYEGLGIALVEAQASGLNCVTSDVVPAEAIVTSRVTALSNQDANEIWAQAVLQGSPPRRQDGADEVRNAGYDIQAATTRLSEYYSAVLPAI